MKYLIILGDGMADEPIPRLGGRTPPASRRSTASQRSAPRESSTPCPKGSLRAAKSHTSRCWGTTFPPSSKDAVRSKRPAWASKSGAAKWSCAATSVEQERIRNHSAGHISTAEAAELIDFLQRRLGSDDVRFRTGVSYRHLLTIRGGDKRLHTVGPHDVPDRPFAEVLPSAADAAAEPTARQLRELIFRSQELLADHPVNRARRAAGKQPATSIWPWSPGYRPRMQTLQERYAPIRNGSVISAVDLIRGIGVCAGLTPVEVEGATGLYDTNYEGKAEAALRALRDEDFVFLHIEASDEAGHEGDAELKVRTIEALDARVVRPIFEAVSAWECPVSLAILPDHPTPCLLRTHTAAPVPFTIWRSGCHPDMVGAYDEQSARRGRYGHLRGDAFIDLFIHGTE